MLSITQKSPGAGVMTAFSQKLKCQIRYSSEVHKVIQQNVGLEMSTLYVENV